MKKIKRQLIGVLLVLMMVFAGAKESKADTLKVPFKQLEAEFTKYDGWKYVYGGYQPSTSFDCSGLVYYVYKSVGYNWTRMTAEGQRRYCKPVSAADRRPGDLIFFGTGSAFHVAIYVGGDKYFDAKNPDDGIGYGKLGYLPVMGYGRPSGIEITSGGSSGSNQSSETSKPMDLKKADVLMVGDSISVGTDGTDLKNNFKSYKFKGTVGAPANKILGYLKDNYEDQDVVIIMSGTNGGLTKSDVDKVMEAAKNSMVFWVVPYTENPSSSEICKKAAQVLRDYKGNSKLHLVEWDKAGKGKLSGDKIHPKNYNDVKNEILKAMKENLREVSANRMSESSSGIPKEEDLVGMVTINGLTTYQTSLTDAMIAKEADFEFEQRFQLTKDRLQKEQRHSGKPLWIARIVLGVFGWGLILFSILRVLAFIVELEVSIPLFTWMHFGLLSPKVSEYSFDDGKRVVSSQWIAGSSFLMFFVGILIVSGVLLNVVMNLIVWLKIK